MFHRYDGTSDYGRVVERVGLNSFPMWALFISLFITVSITFLQSGSIDRWKGMSDEALKNNQQFVEAEKFWLSKNKSLTERYEALQCSHRGLEVTTVKGITLCMNRDTKALHKIDETAD
jgi:hypothetical protein